MNINRVALATTGGDCPGLNSALEAIVRWVHNNTSWELVGLLGGLGCPEKSPVTLNQGVGVLPQAIWAGLPGTVLQGNSKGSKVADIIARGAEVFHQNNIDALISIGGDGSLIFLDELSKKANVPFVSIPKTIDNDVPLTEWSLGHASAVEEVRRAVDSLHSTAYSHGRLFIVEVMGRDAGHLALRGGIAGCAHAILMPERPTQIAALANTVEKAFDSYGYAVVVVSESSPMPDGGEARRMRYSESEVRYGGVAAALGDALGHKRETRYVSLGHTVRGVPPVAFDRMLAQLFAVEACVCLSQQKFNRMVAWQNDKVVNLAIEDVRASKPPTLCSNLLYAAEQLGVYTGDAN